MIQFDVGAPSAAHYSFGNRSVNLPICGAHPAPCHTSLVSRDIARAIAFLAALALGSSIAAPARAYDSPTIDLSAGWSIAPGLMAPDNGPIFGAGATFGFDDTWAIGGTFDWAVHPRFVDAGEPRHFGIIGVEGLYYIDIFDIVPFFGIGIDVMPTLDGSTFLHVDFAAHARVSLDYLLSRTIAIGLDVRAYVLFTALSTEPALITTKLRVSFFTEGW